MHETHIVDVETPESPYCHFAGRVTSGPVTGRSSNGSNTETGDVNAEKRRGEICYRGTMACEVSAQEKSLSLSIPSSFQTKGEGTLGSGPFVDCEGMLISLADSHSVFEAPSDLSKAEA
jgi:hypothetical protein